MTTRQLLLAILVLGLWMGFAARARRLRSLGDVHMRQFAAQSRLVLDLQGEAQAEERESARRLAARHKAKAQQYNVEADFVESFTLTLVLSFVAFSVLSALKTWRKLRVRPPVGDTPDLPTPG